MGWRFRYQLGYNGVIDMKHLLITTILTLVQITGTACAEAPDCRKVLATELVNVAASFGVRIVTFTDARIMQAAPQVGGRQCLVQFRTDTYEYDLIAYGQLVYSAQPSFSGPAAGTAGPEANFHYEFKWRDDQTYIGCRGNLEPSTSPHGTKPACVGDMGVPP